MILGCVIFKIHNKYFSLSYYLAIWFVYESFRQPVQIYLVKHRQKNNECSSWSLFSIWLDWDMQLVP